ncbi:hypothetical protein H5410_000597 [Solanum commersonii]|uniref:Uncharacterized protein n=1 Tax=Solanum commersonii TaxID=4109 RepID=A0A9J6AWM6_SOLCO|nr:hypothetical protein H5410_000597 [Solanum commersonii]
MSSAQIYEELLRNKSYQVPEVQTQEEIKYVDASQAIRILTQDIHVIYAAEAGEGGTSQASIAQLKVSLESGFDQRKRISIGDAPADEFICWLRVISSPSKEGKATMPIGY